MHQPFRPLAGIYCAASHTATGNVGDGPQLGEVNILKKERGGEMKSLRNTVLALAVMLSFAGCAANSSMVAKDTKIKCPKCGSTFTVDEGLRAIQLP